MRYDFRHIDPRTGLPRIIDRDSERIELMSRMPARSGYVRMLHNRISLRTEGNIRYARRMYFNAQTKTLHDFPNEPARATWHTYRLPNGMRPGGWMED